MVDRSNAIRTLYFAVPVLLTLEVVNFPLPIDFSFPAGGWKATALAITIVNLAVCVAAVASTLLALLVLRSRVVPALTIVVAGALSGVELCQFAPFASPLASPLYLVIGGILVAFIPMYITLLVLGFILSKRKDPASVEIAH
jgi:hypothetical protein